MKTNNFIVIQMSQFLVNDVLMPILIEQLNKTFGKISVIYKNHGGIFWDISECYNLRF